jgi:nucleotide-binding universal stress UspA family protein
MFKSILVPTIGFSSDPAALESAILIARRFDAHLDCLHARPDPQQILVQAAGFDMGMGMGTQMVMGDLIDVLQKEDVKRTEKSRKVFETFCAREKLPLAPTPPGSHRGVTAGWQEFTGRELDILIDAARVHDVTVVAQMTPAGGLPRETSGTMLVKSGRPLLLAPARAPKELGRRIAIAWKNTPEAARAVGAAMPLIEKADHVTIISIAESEEETITSAEALATSLRWHGTNVDVSYMAHPGGSIHDTILRATKDDRADLLVMGGYGHSRVSEFVFGGFTRHVLAGVPLPVLLVH